jgi:AcrR family transcriptional regulator
MKKKNAKKAVIGRRPKAAAPDLDTRALILSAARSVFAHRGFEGTTTREVAAAAGVNNAMIYYHFKGKDGLYRSVLEDSFSALAAIWNDGIFRSKEPVRNKIRKYVEGYIRFHQANEDLRRIMAMEFAASGGNITWICEHFFADNFSRLCGIFREGMRNGEIKKIDPSMAVASLIGVIIHNFIMQPMSEHVRRKRVNLSPAKFGAFVIDLFFEGLGTRPKPAGFIGKGEKAQ